MLLALAGCGIGASPFSPNTTSERAWLNPEARRLNELGAEVLRPTDRFEDVTARSGIDAVYRTGREAELLTILESLGGGVCLFDMDGDLDLYCPGGGGFDKTSRAAIGVAGKLFRNDSDCRFTNITAESGLSAPTDYSHGAAGLPITPLARRIGARVFRSLSLAAIRSQSGFQGVDAEPIILRRCSTNCVAQPAYSSGDFASCDACSPR